MKVSRSFREKNKLFMYTKRRSKKRTPPLSSNEMELSQYGGSSMAFGRRLRRHRRDRARCVATLRKKIEKEKPHTKGRKRRTPPQYYLKLLIILRSYIK